MNAPNQTVASEGSVRAESHLDARDRILIAAEKLFAMRGFEGVSTTQIAKVAGVTQPLIHYHFKNKDALWKATVARLFGRFQEEYQIAVQRLPEMERRQRFASVIRLYVLQVARIPEFGQFIMREGTQASGRLDWMVAHWLQPALAQFRELYDEALEKEWVRPMGFHQLVMLVTASAHQYFSLSPMMAALYGVDTQEGGQVQGQAETVARSVLGAVMLGEVEQEIA
ncbi:Transcriptional regulator [gamma proteobacterium HdN1]|nr:Transcriptional regulator [gamma proteobacterium HdN1]